ncbi:MAG: hypothetical protein QF473_05460 [Planctomycetota bacterium]|jgi:hypothetical protein|nr:hypothetical protein [Planctomycetota bacterium]
MSLTTEEKIQRAKIPGFCIGFLAVAIWPLYRFDSKTVKVGAPFSSGQKETRILREANDDSSRAGSEVSERIQPHEWVDSNEIPLLPIPPRAALLASKNRLGDIEASLIIYESWGSFSYALDHLRSDFYQHGWKRNSRFELLASREVTDPLMSYARGHERCLVSLQRLRGSGKIETIMLYAVKDWLRPESGI